MTAVIAMASELLSIVLARGLCGSGEKEDEAKGCLFVSIGVIKVIGVIAVALPGVAWWRMRTVMLPVSTERWRCVVPCGRWSFDGGGETRR